MRLPAEKIIFTVDWLPVGSLPGRGMIDSYPLEWEELPSRRDCRIASYLNSVDPEDEADWPRQHEWLAKRLNDFHRVLAHRVKALEVASQIG